MRFAMSELNAGSLSVSETQWILVSPGEIPVFTASLEKEALSLEYLYKAYITIQWICIISRVSPTLSVWPSCKFVVKPRGEFKVLLHSERLAHTRTCVKYASLAWYNTSAKSWIVNELRPICFHNSGFEWHLSLLWFDRAILIQLSP